MAPRIIHTTSCAEKNKNISGSFFYIVSYFTLFVWPVFNWIGQLFEWDQELDSIDTEKFDRSPLNFHDDIFVEEFSNAGISAASSEHRLLEDLEHGLETLKAQISTYYKQIQVLRQDQLRKSRNEFQKSVVEQDWLNDNFEKTVGKTNKMAVENHEEKFESKQVKLETKTNFNHGPKIWHCSGGNGSDTPAKNEPTLKETKLGNRATTFPCDRCENNDGGFGGDDNDPSRTTPKLMKGHYVESAFPLKNKDTEALATSAENSNSNTSIGLKSEKEDKASEEVQMDSPFCLGLGNMSAIASNMNDVSVDGSSAVDKNGSSTVDKNGSSTMQLDTPADSDNEFDGNSGDYSDGSLSYSDFATDAGHYPSNFRSSGTEPLESSYKILHPFLAALTVCIDDGLYRLNRDYTIVQEIGNGMSGTCYKILDICSGKYFALKKIASKIFNPNELKIWSMANTKFSSNWNQVKLLGAYDDGKYVNIFMELMDGTLKYVADNCKALAINERKVAALIKPILKCLADFHRAGYVYADIKPENILIGADNVKLCDFGLTVDLGEKTAIVGYRGTVPYMPKELFCGDGEYRPSVDIYELGGVMLYLLSGVRPWADYCQSNSIIYKVGSGEVPEVPKDCSEQMQKLLERILHPDYKERPTAQELLQHSIFSDDSGLEKILVEVLVDVQLFRKSNCASSPRTVDDSDENFEEAEPLPLL